MIEKKQDEKILGGCKCMGVYFDEQQHAMLALDVLQRRLKDHKVRSDVKAPSLK